MYVDQVYFYVVERVLVLNLPDYFVKLIPVVHLYKIRSRRFIRTYGRLYNKPSPSTKSVDTTICLIIIKVDSSIKFYLQAATLINHSNYLKMIAVNTPNAK